jgi:hypothetical protein
MRIIKVATVKESGVFDFFKKDEPEKVNPEDRAIDFLQENVLSKVKSDFNRAMNLDRYNPNVTDVKFLLGRMSNMYKVINEKYVSRFVHDPSQKERINEILFGSSNVSNLQNQYQEVKRLQDEALNIRESSEDRGEYLIKSKEYSSALIGLWSLFYEFYANFLKEIGKDNILPR